MTQLLPLLPLLVAALVVRGIGRSPKGEPWSPWLDPLLLVVAGLLTYGVWTVVGTRPGAPWVSGADFNQYCGIVRTMRGDGTDMWSGIQRSAAAGWVPGQFAGAYGIVGGLFVSSAIASVVTGSALYLWGRALHSRTAGIAAALLTAVFYNLVVLRVNMDFYPLMVAAFCASGALAVAAGRWPGVGSALGAGVGAGVALLVDVRGLLWAAPALVAAGLGLCHGPWRRWPLRLVALVLPVAASWPLGRFAYRANAYTLDQEVALFNADVMRQGLGNALDPRDSFLWGWGPFENLLPMLLRVANTRLSVPVDAVHGLPPSLEPWVVPGLVAAALTVITLLRAPRLLVAALIAAAPSALAVWSGLNSGMGGRHLDTGFPLLLVVLGVAWAELACRAPEPPSPRGAALGLGAVLLGLLVAADVVDTPLSRFAATPWYIGASRDVSEMVNRAHAASGPPRSGAEPCDDALYQDRERGVLPVVPAGWDAPPPALARPDRGGPSVVVPPPPAPAPPPATPAPPR